VRDQCVTIPALGVFGFRQGETIRTEISGKYDRPTVAGLLGSAGLRLEAWREDAEGLFALALGGVA
jgi:L-histidine Nalpha-methyltransferase